jgi:hypothetical protein
MTSTRIQLAGLSETWACQDTLARGRQQGVERGLEKGKW